MTNATSWRDLADQLSERQIAELEYCEREQVPPGMSSPQNRRSAAKSLRALMTRLLDGIDYTFNQASYDLARLRLNGLITRVPGKNRYRLTGDGLRFAIFYTKLHDRLLRPLLAADQLPARPPPRKTLRTSDTHIA